jgi:hypothetical protein
VRKIALLALAIALVPAAAQGFSAPKTPRLQTLAHVDPGGGYSADIYVHKGFAYLSSWHGRACPGLGVRVYDVHEPSHPRRVSTYADLRANPSLGGSWTEKTIVQHVHTAAFTGELAVTSFQACGGRTSSSFRGFGLYDVSDPAHPRKLALVRTDPRGSHEIWLQPVGKRAYVYTAIPYSELESSPTYNATTGQATVPGKPDFRIFDVSDPTHPVQVGQWGAWKELGIYPRKGRGHFSFNYVHSVRTNAAGTLAYLSYWDLGTVILDIRNPQHPRYLGRTHFLPGEEGDAHSTALAHNGKLLIETHETGLGKPTFWNIGNPRHPVRLSEFSPPKRLYGSAPPDTSGLTDSVHDPKVVGNRVYFSWYGLGVLLVDFSNPRHPRFLARFLPSSSRDPEQSFCQGKRCSLTWGVYPVGNVVFASDMIGGLWIFRAR